MMPLDVNLETIVARTNREAMAFLGRCMGRQANAAPFERHTLLVDSQAIGRNVVAHVAEVTGMAVGVEPVLLRPLLRRITHGIATIDHPPLPPLAWRALTHHTMALALLEVIPTILDGHGVAPSDSTQHVLRPITEATDDTTRLALASELARSLDAALQAGADAPGLAPWVSELSIALEAHAKAMAGPQADDRLSEAVAGWPRLLTSLATLSGDQAAPMRAKLQARGFLPRHVLAFDLTVYADTPQSRALQLLATIVPVTLVVVDPVGDDPPDNASLHAASQAWSLRSRRPIHEIKKFVSSLGLELQSAASPDQRAAAETGRLDRAESLLNAIQHSVEGAAAATGPFAKDDRSLSIHHVVSDTRAAEVARDAIHQAFLDLDGLLPEQIAVVSDDPRRDSPFIEAAFESIDAASESLPVTITGTLTRDWDIGIDAFLAAVRLAPTSFAHDAVFQIIAMPPVASGLGLEPDDVESLSRNTRQAGLRAYLDSDHRTLAIGAGHQTDHCTWRAALRSLAMSMAMPDGGHEQVSAAGIVAAGGMKASDMDQLAAMSRIIDILAALRALCAGGPMTEMVERARLLARRLFGSINNGYATRWSKSRDKILTALDEIEADAKAVGFGNSSPGTIDYFWFAGEVARRLNRASTGTRCLHGGISLLEPSQARGRAPRVTVFLLSDRFPTEDRPLSPDPFSASHPGRILRQHVDLRDVFSVFMNTGERAVFVVPSMCDRTHEQLSMSSVIHDIRAIAQSVALGHAGNDAPFLEHSATVVPHSILAAQSPLLTRHRGALRGAAALCLARCGTPCPQTFGLADVSASVPSEVSLDDFARFFEKPIESFLERRGIFVQDIEDERRLREPLEPSFLDRWQLWDAAFRMAGDSLSAGRQPGQTEQRRLLAIFQANGLLRPDRLGLDYLIDHQVTGFAVALVQAAALQHGFTPIDVTVDYSIAGQPHRLRIHGDVLLANGAISLYSVSSLKPRSILKLAAIQSVCAAAHASATWQMTHVEKKQCVVKNNTCRENFVGRCGPFITASMPIPLDSLARIWHLGQQMPLPLLSEALEKSLPKNPPSPPDLPPPPDLQAARKEFYRRDIGFGGGQGREAKARTVYRSQNPIIETQFPGSAGILEADFARLAQFFSGQIADPYPSI